VLPRLSETPSIGEEARITGCRPRGWRRGDAGLRLCLWARDIGSSDLTRQMFVLRWNKNSLSVNAGLKNA
jgi:hypothetical protein